MSKNIVLGKLISGEVIIGKEDNDQMTDAYLVNVIPEHDNKSFNVMLLPLFVPIAKEGVNIKYDKIITTTTAPESIKNEYIKVVSDIIIPTKTRNQNEIPNLTKLFK